MAQTYTVKWVIYLEWQLYFMETNKNIQAPYKSTDKHLATKWLGLLIAELPINRGRPSLQTPQNQDEVTKMFSPKVSWSMLNGEPGLDSVTAQEEEVTAYDL